MTIRYGSVCSGVEAATLAWHQLGWQPQWSFEKTIEATVNWYLKAYNGHDIAQCCMHDISDFVSTS